MADDLGVKSKPQLKSRPYGRGMSMTKEMVEEVSRQGRLNKLEFEIGMFKDMVKEINDGLKRILELNREIPSCKSELATMKDGMKILGDKSKSLENTLGSLEARVKLLEDDRLARIESDLEEEQLDTMQFSTTDGN